MGRPSALPLAGFSLALGAIIGVFYNPDLCENSRCVVVLFVGHGSARQQLPLGQPCMSNGLWQLLEMPPTRAANSLPLSNHSLLGTRFLHTVCSGSEQRRAQVEPCVCGHRRGCHCGRAVPGALECGWACRRILCPCCARMVMCSSHATTKQCLSATFKPSLPRSAPQSYSFNYMGQKLGRRVRVRMFRALLRQVG